MKKLICFFTMLSLLFTQLALASDTSVPKCYAQKTNQDVLGMEHLCNNVDDIICKDVKKEERRGCSESDQYIIRKNMSANEVFSFAQGCFKSAVTSFKNFFTDFVPELLSSMWKLLRGAGELTANSFSSDSKDVGWLGKIKGIYETSRSVAVDIYEAAKQSPGEFMSNIWDKMVDAIGPAVASYDCLRPQVKVEKICGFVAGWVLPPAMFAKLLIKGSKFVKESIATGGVAIKAAEKLKLQKMLELAEKRPRLTMQQYQTYYDHYKKLGYTDEEFEALYKSGDLTKTKLEEVRPKKVAANSGDKKKLTYQQSKAIKETMGHDYISVIIKDKTGKNIPVAAKVSERIYEELNLVHYRVSYVDPKTGLIKDVIATEEMLAGLKVAPGNSAVEKIFESAAAKDKNYKDPLTLYNEAVQTQKNKPVVVKPAVKEVKVEGVEVSDASYDDFEKALKKSSAKAPAMKPAGDAIEFHLDEASVAKAKEANEAIRRKIEAENAEAKARKIREAAAVRVSKKIGTHGEKLVSETYKSNYLVINAKNSMGMATTMPLEIVKKVNEGGREKILVRIYDTTSKTFQERKLTEAELRVLSPKDSSSAFRSIKSLQREVGIKDNLLN